MLKRCGALLGLGLVAAGCASDTDVSPSANLSTTTPSGDGDVGGGPPGEGLGDSGMTSGGSSALVGGDASVVSGPGRGGSVRCAGKPGASGDETRTWNGVPYIVHFPPKLDPNRPVPLLFVAHGFTMNGALMQALTNFDAKADSEGFVVVYPNGDGGVTPWNVGRRACPPGGFINAPGADSFGYLDGIRASIEDDVCIHPEQIFVTGLSMGGYFTHHVACQRGNEFVRAAGPHSGGTYSGHCPGAPVPMFIMHGANDDYIDNVLCGQGARDYWIARNGCDSAFDVREIPGASCEWYRGCERDGQTVYCEFAGVGHSWAGQNATDAVWDFFQRYL